jgi:hypothetical protein
MGEMWAASILIWAKTVPGDENVALSTVCTGSALAALC